MFPRARGREPLLRRAVRTALKQMRGRDPLLRRQRRAERHMGLGIRRARTLNPRIGGFLGIELKFYDQKLITASLGSPTDASAGEHNPSATVSLNTVTQGDGESQRDGRKITMKSIMVEGTITVGLLAAQSTAKTSAQIFIALVLDTQTNGALLNSEDVFTNPGANAETAAMPFRNLQFTKRFKVLATRKFSIGNPNMTNDTGSTGGVISNGLTKRFKIFKKLNNIQVLFSNTTETIANITDNGLNIVAFCTSTSLTPKLSYSSRLRFVG